jgi:hypothetical protein
MKKRPILPLLLVAFVSIALADEVQNSAPAPLHFKEGSNGWASAISSGRVVEILQAEANGARFVAYILDWNGQRIVVDSRSGRLAHKVGDVIDILVMTGKGVLYFEMGEPPPCDNTAPEQVDDHAAREVLDKMIQAYAVMRSYSDSGVVIMHINDKVNDVSFETLFARPSFFRFAWSSRFQLSPRPNLITTDVIWSDGTDVFKRYDLGDKRPAKTEKAESLSMAVAEATGVSLGSAQTVAALLLPDMGFSLGDLRSPRLLGIEDVEGTDAHHIIGATCTGEIEVWIGRDDHLIRKTRMPDLDSEEIRRDIRINAEIPLAEFAR